jgi:hypothetical protein
LRAIFDRARPAIAVLAAISLVVGAYYFGFLNAQVYSALGMKPPFSAVELCVSTGVLSAVAWALSTIDLYDGFDNHANFMAAFFAAMSLGANQISGACLAGAISDHGLCDWSINIKFPPPRAIWPTAFRPFGDN